MNIRTLPERRGKNWGRAATHCVNGHRFEDANTYWNEDGWRKCMTCDNARRKALRAARVS